MNTQKIVFCRGLPGSGKSTWAKDFVSKNSNWVRTNMDDIREKYYPNTKFSKEREVSVISIEDNEIIIALNDGKNIVNDNTNFNSVHRERILKIAKSLNINVVWEIKEFNTNLAECIRRNSKRDNPIPLNAIMRMWSKYLKPTPIKYNKNLSDAIIVDVDGTLADKGDKSPYDRDFSLDTLIVPVGQLIRTQKAFYGDKLNILITTGRHESSREITKKWLFENNIPFDEIFMRPNWGKEKNEPHDFIIKTDIYNNKIKDKYNILYCIDDRKQIKYTWLELGLFVFDVNQTDDDF